MGLSEVCNTGLALALVSHHEYKPSENHLSHPDHQEKKKRKKEKEKEMEKEKFSLKYDHLFPSLTLGPSDETYTHQLATDQMVDAEKVSGESVHLHKQASSLSAASSFSNSSEGEEVEVEKVSSRISNEDEEASPRKKLRLTKEQSAILEDSFKEHATLNPVYLLSLSSYPPSIVAASIIMEVMHFFSVTDNFFLFFFSFFFFFFFYYYKKKKIIKRKIF
jgi:homeobox-leucine zipper protein